MQLCCQAFVKHSLDTTALLSCHQPQEVMQLLHCTLLASWLLLQATQVSLQALPAEVHPGLTHCALLLLYRLLTSSLSVPMCDCDPKCAVRFGDMN
jgi:hypothetical protein